MEGAIGGDGSSLGIIPRSVARLFEVRERMIEAQGWEFDMQASQLEIYNENIRDLLVVPGSVDPPKPGDFKIKHGTAAEGSSTIVTNLTSHPVSTTGDVLGLLKTAKANRSVAAVSCIDRRMRTIRAPYLYDASDET